MDDQWEVITSEELGEIQEAMKKSLAEGVAMVKEFLDKKKNTPLNIAITGESGSGKSSFVNAFRGIPDGDEEEAAPTGVVETTTEVKAYPHPNHPNVTLWDLPGVGTPNFPAAKYLEIVGFEKFDFFIMISATRFKENDVNLAQEIKKMGKNFYFLRSKIDSDLYSERRRRNFDKQKTLDVIKEDCIKASRTVMDDQWEVITSEEVGEIQEAMKKGLAEGVAMVKEFLDKKENTPLNIAITGESGSGKSSFVNAFRGIPDGDEEEAAPTGVVETTTEVKAYPHPNHPNVILWDLPGVGTPNFPAAKYLEIVGFEKFDFFIIISATRFKENDVNLAQEIKRMRKKFYFLRSKIDSDLYSERRRRNFDKQKTLDVIKEDCIKGLRDQGIEAPQVFLVSSFELHDFDFHLLEETLERELPRHKRNVFLYAMPNISMQIIKKKKEAYQAQIKYHVIRSSAVEALSVPGLSTAVDLVLVASVVGQYVFGFGLDEKSLKRLADSSGVPFSDLLSVMTSELGATKITPELIKKMLSQISNVEALIAAEEVSRFFLVIGIPAAMCLSGVATYKILTFLLDLIAVDAQKVFEKAVGKNTEV